MINVLANTINYLTERAGGLLLALTGSSVGYASVELSKNDGLSSFEKWAYVTTTMVAILTIISFGYKFYKFCKNTLKKDK